MTAALLSRSPEEGARLLALSLLDQTATARLRLADPEDAEALHDFRVGLRRLRSCLRAYRECLADAIPKKLARRLRRLARSTGPGRDAEVQIEWLRGRKPHLSSYHRAGLAWLLDRLEERMRDAYAKLTAEVDRDFVEIESELRARLSVYRTEVHLDAAQPPATFGDTTTAILRRQVAELEDHLARIADAADEREAHRARISAKRVRYLLEPFAGEVDGAAAVVKRFKAVQDLFGDLHDAHMLELEIADALEDAAAGRARRLLEISLDHAPDDKLLRAERRRPHESGLIALARFNRTRRDRLFEALAADWLGGKAGEFLREVEGLGEAMTTAP
ncbi:MAG TPA: CHAD domain-containing protein [Thermoanaerobaculia bacterium]|jgi:CHAD domain-containing protein|nr:CHAD domain-containing protein [Thermoanaerobaculia bacterium]